MAAKSSPDPILRRLEGLPAAMAAGQRQVAEQAGAAFQRSTEAAIREATGGDGVLSGMTRTTKGRRSTPRPMGSFTKVERTSNGFQAFVRATGAVHLVEHDIARHIVTSRWAQGSELSRPDRTLKSGSVRKGRSTIESRQTSVAFGLGAAGGGRRAVLHWGDVFARYTVASSKGRKPWRRGVDEAAPQLAEIQARVQRAAIRSALR